MMKIAPSRPFSSLFAGLVILTVIVASTARGANKDTRVVDGTPPPLSGSELAGGWRLVRTQNPHGGSDAISIMHTADTSKSDSDLAGLMIRCHGRSTEVVVVLLRAFQPRARPHVLFSQPGHETPFDATVAAPGTAIVLPGTGEFLVSEPWLGQSDLSIRVSYEQTTIAGVIPLRGLQAAFKILVTDCSML